MNNYLLISPSKSIIDKKIEELIKKGFTDASITTYDLEEDSITTLLEDADTISFLASNKVIIGNNFNLDLDLTYLFKYLDNPNPNVLLILTSSKLDERKKIGKELKQKINYWKLEVDARNIIKDIFKDKKIDTRVINTLEEYFKDDNERLISECEKLNLAFINDKEITYDKAKDIIIKPLNNSDNLSFSLVRNIALKDKKESLLNYQELLSYNIESYALMGLLESQYRLLYQVKVLNNKNISYNEIAKILEVHPFRVKKTLELIRYYCLKEISNILKNLALNDYKMKSGLIEADMLIDLLILNIK